MLLASTCCGTDVDSCFALGGPLLPFYPSELQRRGFGMKVEILADDSKPVWGKKGDLARTAPFPSMPASFWNDPDGEQYQAVHFSHVRNVWCHGDHALLTEHDGVIIYGRPDVTLNPGGVRIGLAEIYRQVEQIPEVYESVAFGQHLGDYERVILFVRLRNDILLDDALRERIAKQIRANTTPRHAPAKILQVADIPRTISGKITEIAVGDTIHGLVVMNTDSLANLQALEYFRDLAELR